MRRFALAFAALCTLLAAGSTRADWPMARHDVRRTALGDGAARIERPAASLRHYLGGSLGSEQYVAADVDGDGSAEVIFLMGGALIAKTPDDAVVWETDALDLFRLDGLVDLDGDGTSEVVLSAVGGRMHAVRVSDGAVRWSLPSGLVGNVGAVRFADFDEDGTTDLYLAETACGSTGALGDVGLGYSFASGLGAPSMLFSLERGRRDYICGANDAVVDIDGDGRLEVVAQGLHHFYVYSTIDGALEATSEDVGSIPYGSAMTRLADVDDDGRMEIVAWTNNDYAPPLNSRRVFLMDWDEASGTLVKRWERSVTDLRDDRHAFTTGGLEDFGSDGRWEIVTSFYSAATSAWTTVVLDARTGAELDSVSRGPFRGLADLDADGSSEVLTGDAGVGLSAFRVTDTGFERLFTAPGVEPVFVRDTAHHTASARSRALALDLDRDGTSELVALHFGGGRADALVALAGDADPPREHARLALGPDVALSTFEPFASVTRPYPQLLVARSDGYLWVLDDRLRATNADLSGEIPQRGLRIGGFYSGSSGLGLVPVAADLDGDGAAEILARDSRGVLQRLSTAGASLVEPPRVDWEVPGGSMPSIVDLTGDGGREVVLAIGAHEIRAVRASDASTVWSALVGSASRTVSYDPLVGDLDGDGVLDVAYQLSSSSGGTVIVDALSGAGGTTLWPAPFETVVAGSGLGAMALADRDGDGLLDLLTTPRNLFWWRRGTDGADLGSVGASYPGHGVFFDADGDGTDELFASGAVQAAAAFETDLTPLWSDAGSQHTRVHGAAVACSGGTRFVQAHHHSARISAWNAATGEIAGDVALRDGRRWDPPSSAPEGPGILGDVTLARDLVGTGAPTALVPSTDGHLYAIDPCTMALQWALDFRFPVGSPILADTDGDGEDEIVVTVADGFLYAVDREVIAAPLFVVENDGRGPASGPGDDIDEIVTTDTLHANWASVEGAVAYEYAVMTPGGAFLTRPSFINAGNVTQVRATGLPLRAGQRYLFAVRAIGAEGSSSETLSDGILVLPDPCAACGPDQRCVEGECRPDPCAGLECGAGRVCVEGTCMSVNPDGGTQAPDGGVSPDGGTTGAGGGCCTIAPGASSPGGAALAIGAIGVAIVARRRRRR